MMHRLVKRIYNFWKFNVKVPKSSQNFMARNREIFSNRKKIHDNLVLIELNPMHSSHVAYAYLANALANKHDARIVAYEPRIAKNIWQRINFFVGKLFNLNVFGIYQSFQTNEFAIPALSRNQKRYAKLLFNDVFPKLTSCQDVENISIDKTWIGDLIYDTYLRENNLPTVNFKSENFKKHLLTSLELFVFWQNYFDQNNVKAINVSHCVYNLAIPLRVAVARDIPAYQANITHIFRMRPSNLFAYNDFHYFPSFFKRLPKNMKNEGLIEAKKRIERRFAGEIGVDMSYSTKTAFTKAKQTRLLEKSLKKKIFVPVHCFFDSPHSYGKNLFSDFYEWIKFLGKISETTDYEWYLKTHPDFIPETAELISELVSEYPKFRLLPSDASHHQIISEGIDVVLTVYGTVGFEYAALGVLVINASLNNPHVAYNFNLHPKTIEEYEQLLMSLDAIDHKIDIDEVYEYYFMRFIYNTENIFLSNYAQVISNIGGYSEQFTPSFYDVWNREFSKERHQQIENAIENFIESGDFRMGYNHFEKDLAVQEEGAKK